MTSVVLHVVHRRPVVMKERVFAMGERSFCFVGSSDIVFRVRMLRRLRMVPHGGLVVIGRHEMQRPSGEIRRRGNGR